MGILNKCGGVLLVALVGVSTLCISTTPATAKPAASRPSLDDAKFAPGKETQIDDPKTGGDGHWLVYLPADYNPARKWPVIYCYHGLGGEPTAGPFRELTNGKGYIIVGMEYQDRRRGNGDIGPTPAKDLPNLHRIHEQLLKRLPIDEKLLFVGGMSQGGWASNGYFEANLDMFAGCMFFGAGRDGEVHPVDPRLNLPPVPTPNFKGKPVFIGIGEKDESRAFAERAEKFYKTNGADVTLEIFPKLGHAVNTKSAKAKQWLLDHGPLLAVKSNVAAAHLAEKTGKLGQAYALYQVIAADPNAAAEADTARTSAEAIGAGADKILSDADSAITGKKYLEATKNLLAVKIVYAGSPWAEKIESRLATLQNDPTIKAEIEQTKIDAAADAIEAAALSAEKAKDYKQAIAGYQAYVAAYPKSHRIVEVRQRLATLKADKSIQSGIASKQADTDCKAWLGLAHSYIANGSPDQARPYLQKVIDKYPGTDYATTAAQELADLK